VVTWIEEDNYLYITSKDTKPLIVMGDENGHFYCEDLNSEELDVLLKCNIEDIPNNFGAYCAFNQDDNSSICSLQVNEYLKTSRSTIIILTMYFWLESWDNPFSPHQFAKEFIESTKSDFNSDYFIEDSNLYIECTIPHEVGDFGLHLASFSNELNTIRDKVTLTLTKKHAENSLINIFDFPPEYSNICSQYLIWFGEFLKSLGIEADVHTEPRNGKTALIVSPKENGELLTKIKELFYRYIDLPYMEYIPYNAENMNIHQKYKIDSLLDEIGDYQHKLKKAMRHQRLLEAENDGLLEDKIKLKTNVKELEKDKLLLKSCLKDPKKNEIFSCLNKSFSIVSSVDTKNDLTVCFGVEIKPKGMIKEMFKGKDKSEKTDSEKSIDN
jgi:hypothetical protein